MSAAKGNQSALKGAVAATSHLHIRVTPHDKAGWVRAAAGQKLAPWVIETLNGRAGGTCALRDAVISAARARDDIRLIAAVQALDRGCASRTRTDREKERKQNESD